MEPFLGEIKIFGGNYAPRGYALCNGQVLAIAQNNALFSLLGTMYGGNGQTTFALPDLQGRLPVHPGQGPGLPPVVQGQVLGQPSVTLTTSQMPAHDHTLTGTIHVVQETGPTRSPVGGFIAGDAGAQGNYQGAEPPPVTVPAAANAVTVTLGSAGGGQPIPTQSPALGVNFIIALQGVYPSRN